jgi:hypothetical protein
MNAIWSEAEKNFIKANASLLTDAEIAARLSQLSGRIVTLHAVRKARKRLNISKLPGRGVCELDMSKTLPVPAMALHIQGD